MKEQLQKEAMLREAADKSARADTMTGSSHHKKLVERLVVFAKSESVKEYHSDLWINVSERLPILKRRYEGMLPVVENSVEVIVSDGKTSWVDYYTFDEGFHESIIKWQPIPKP